MLYNLHLLRAIAALGVVHFHITSVAGLRLDWDVGSRGVDVFFVISGFIIAYIGTSKPDQFFIRRLIRVVPFYWAATLVVFAAVHVAPRLFRTTEGGVTHLLFSLLFLPRELPGQPGEVFPTLILGWSLNYEMYFYVLFALALRFFPKHAPLLCCVAIVAIGGAIRAFASSSSTLEFYARPIALEFCFGVGVFYAFRWLDRHKSALAKRAVGRWLLGLVLVGSLALLVLFEHYERDTVARHLSAGIPSFFLVLSALLLERVYGVASKSRVIYLLGEASYVIYLVHPYIIYSVLRLVIRDPNGLSSPVLALLIVGLLALSSVIGVAIHLWFEKPVMAYLREILAPTKPSVAA